MVCRLHRKYSLLIGFVFASTFLFYSFSVFLSNDKSRIFSTKRDISEDGDAGNSFVIRDIFNRRLEEELTYKLSLENRTAGVDDVNDFRKNFIKKVFLKFLFYVN